MNLGVPGRPRARFTLVAAGLVAAACAATAAPPTSTPATNRPVWSPRPPVVATVAPTISATPVPTLARPTEPAQPTPEAAQGAIARFLTEFAGNQSPFRIDIHLSGTVATGEEDVTFTLSMKGDVSGPDFDGELVMPTGKAKFKYVDGVGYTRLPRGTWVVAQDFEQTQPLNPFNRLEPADLTYVETLGDRGKRVHVFKTERWLGGPLEVERVTDLELVSTSFAIHIRDDGIPVRGLLNFEIEGTTAQGRARFDYHVVYRFSRVGQPVTIEAPEV